MADPKKHHYIPRAILKRFSIRNEGRQVHVFDKASRRAYVAAIQDAGSENHFYSVEVGDQRLVLEHLFNDIDNEGAILLNKICEVKSLGTLSEAERGLLCAIAAAQLLRVKRMRNDLIDVSHQLLATLEKFGGIASQELNEHVMSDSQARIATIENLSELPFFTGHFSEKNIVLIGSGGNSFFIGDNPVVVSNSFPYGELGLSSPGVEIYFPISRDFAVGFYCRSIRNHLERFEAWGEKRYQPLLDSMRCGDPVEFSLDEVTSLNQLQIYRSTQYLYSADPDFSLVIAMLDDDPSTAHGKASVQSGWEGYVRRDAMPMGTFVVAVGQETHSMIPAEIVQDSSGDCEWAFRTPLPEMVRAAISDGPLKEVTLYVDKMMRSQIRDVIFAIKDDGVVSVRMRDEALHRLFQTIDDKRSSEVGGQIEEPRDRAPGALAGEPVKRFSREGLQEFVALGQRLVAEGGIPESQLEGFKAMEERLRDAPQEEWDSFNYFLENVSFDNSLASVISSGDRIVQEKVREFIRTRLPNPAALESVDLTADYCIALGEALCHNGPEPARLWGRIRKLHKLKVSTSSVPENEATAGFAEEFLSAFEDIQEIPEPLNRLGRAIFSVYSEISWLVSVAGYS